jgi:hypothetical protein
MELVLFQKRNKNWAFLIFILVWIAKNYIEILIEEILKEILKEMVKEIISSLARYVLKERQTPFDVSALLKLLVSGLCKTFRSFGNK